MDVLQTPPPSLMACRCVCADKITAAAAALHNLPVTFECLPVPWWAASWACEQVLSWLMVMIKPAVSSCAACASASADLKQRCCHAPHARHSSLFFMLHTMAASCRSASMSASSDFVTESAAAVGTPNDFCGAKPLTV